MEHALIDDLIRLKLRRDEAAAETDRDKHCVARQGYDLYNGRPAISSSTLSARYAARRVEILSRKPIRAYRQLVYDCCPLLHDVNLHSELGVIDPYDAVDKLFTPLEVMEIGDRLAESFSAIESDLKN